MASSARRSCRPWSPRGIPILGGVMGPHAEIEAARLADVREFFENFYTPSNATLAIVGDF